MDHSLLAGLRAAITQIATHYEQREYGRAMRQTMELADRVNVYIDAAKPWELAKDATQAASLHETCSVCLEAFRLLTLALKPVLPSLAAAAERFLAIAPLNWSDATQPLSSQQTINPYQHLMTRVDPRQIEVLLEANRSRT
jgi:methionyl-tRNA synthetase